MISLTCRQCGEAFSVRDYRRDTAKFCSFRCNMLDKRSRFKTSSFEKGSTPWNKGKKGVMPEPWNKGKVGVQEAWNKGAKGLNVAWNKGKKNWMVPPLKGKKNQKLSGDKHWNWKGGITDENRLFRNSGQYRDWRRKVFERDRFSCVNCGYRSCKSRDIRADHIKPFCLFPELRLDVDNGRTLCLPCDLKLGWNNKRDKVKFNVK